MQDYQVKLSVIVPVYNVKDYLPRCLDSIVNQTLKGIEIVVVDDGSTDGCADIVDEYASRYSNIVAIHKENGGLMSAWTTGVRASKGDYLGFVDSDDYIELYMFERMYMKIKETNSDIVWCDYRKNVNQNVFGSDFHAGQYVSSDLYEIKSHIFPIPSLSIMSNSRCTKLFKRELIDKNLIYTESLSRTYEDRYIVPAVIMDARSMFYIKEPLYVYTYNRSGCNSKKYKKELWKEILRLYYTQKQMLLDKSLYETYSQYWERSLSNFIIDYVRRNIIGIASFYTRVQSSRCIINDSLCQSCVMKYGNDLTGRLGNLIKTAFKFHSPILLALFSYLGKK